MISFAIAFELEQRVYSRGLHTCTTRLQTLYNIKCPYNNLARNLSPQAEADCVLAGGASVNEGGTPVKDPVGGLGGVPLNVGGTADPEGNGAPDGTPEGGAPERNSGNPEGAPDGVLDGVLEKDGGGPPKEPVGMGGRSLGVSVGAAELDSARAFNGAPEGAPVKAGGVPENDGGAPEGKPEGVPEGA